MRIAENAKSGPVIIWDLSAPENTVDTAGHCGEAEEEEMCFRHGAGLEETSGYRVWECVGEQSERAVRDGFVSALSIR